jgi:hypothetical protein
MLPSLNGHLSGFSWRLWPDPQAEIDDFNFLNPPPKSPTGHTSSNHPDISVKIQAFVRSKTRLRRSTRQRTAMREDASDGEVGAEVPRPSFSAASR